jgi:hypothetical protein
MHQSGRPVWGWRETLALPRPQKIIRPAHTPLKSDFYNKIGQQQTHALQQKSGIGRHDPGRFYSGTDGFFLVFHDDCFGSQADITPNSISNWQPVATVGPE